MNRNDKQRELFEYIKFNYDSIDTYLKSLNLIGIREQLSLFGIDTNHNCKLNIEDLRKILKILLEYNNYIGK